MELTTEARFGGVWSVSREIEDFASGQDGRFRGLARLSGEEGGMRYAEHGRMTLGAAQSQAHRVYLWRFGEGARVEVLFEDGRAFHAFDWSRAVSEDSHLCAEDLYEVRYSFAAESWHARWRVRGPRKDYAMVTRYLRLSGGDAALAASGPAEYRGAPSSNDTGNDE